MLSIPKSIPRTPGVYIFSKKNTPLYIGKALNLRRRLTSYWRKRPSAKTRTLLKEATRIRWEEIEGEIGALIREAQLIKQHLPKYNILMRDDKNYSYVGITREDFPKIFVTHQPSEKQKVKSKKQNDKSKLKIKYWGPFTNANALKTTLKLLRRIFLYCTCKESHVRPCLYAHIGACFGFCCTTANREIKKEDQKRYQKNIAGIVAVLSGRTKKFLTGLKRAMHTASREQRFERAALLRNQIAGIENIFAHRSFVMDQRRTVRWDKIRRTLAALLGAAKPFVRVEGYDIANISGREATGSMVVFRNGMPDKNEYRKFRIKTVHQPSDVDMLKEVLRRRLRHHEWPRPDFILIDGGKPQLHAVRTTLSPHPLFRTLAMAALAKKEEELYLPRRKDPIRLDGLPPDTALFLQRVRDEAHRFARVYHHRLRAAHTLN